MQDILCTVVDCTTLLKFWFLHQQQQKN